MKEVKELPEWAKDFPCKIGNYCEVMTTNYTDEGIAKGEIGLIESLGIHPIYGFRMACVRFKNTQREWVNVKSIKELDSTDCNFNGSVWEPQE